jgi:hypothetical protein
MLGIFGLRPASLRFFVVDNLAFSLRRRQEMERPGRRGELDQQWSIRNVSVVGAVSHGKSVLARTHHRVAPPPR